MYKKAIEQTVKCIKSDLFPKEDIEDIKQLFEFHLERMWLLKREPDFKYDALVSLWWYAKIHFLSLMANDPKAKAMLEKELNENAAKLMNPDFKLKKVKA